MGNNFLKDIDHCLDGYVKSIALARRSHIVLGGDAEEFDKVLNELCEKWHAKFEDMDATDVAMFMVTDMLDGIKDMSDLKERR